MSSTFDPKTHGPFQMLVANLFFGMVPIGVRWASLNGIPSDETTTIRFVIACLAVAGIVALGWGKLSTGNARALAWRGVFGGFAVLFYFYAISASSAGKGTLLNYTHSLWANLALVIFFGQKPPRGFWLLMATAFVGLWLVLSPDFSSVNWGDALGLISGWCGAGAIITVKELRKTDNALTIFAAFSLVGLAFALFPGLLPLAMGHPPFGAWVFPGAMAWLILLFTGLAAMAGQIIFTHAYAYTSIPLGTILSLSVPVMATLGGWALLHEPLTPHFLLGGLLVLIPCGWIGFQEGRNSDPTDA